MIERYRGRFEDGVAGRAVGIARCDGDGLNV